MKYFLVFALVIFMVVSCSEDSGDGEVCNGVCDSGDLIGTYDQETDSWHLEEICPSDCSCGDGVCDDEEDWSASCPQDCCGDGVCGYEEEEGYAAPCPADCN